MDEVTALSGKQKRFLRAKGNRLEDRLVIGHGGISDNCKKNLNDLLTQFELVKVRLKPAAGLDRKEAAVFLVNKSGAQLIQVFGSTVLLYRQNAEKRVIKLP